MEQRRLVVNEITEEEEREFASKRSEILNSRSRTHKIPVSGNDIDIDEWREAFSIAEPYTHRIMDLFYFYEDGKDFMRVH